MTELTIVGTANCVGVLNLELMDAVLLRKALYQLRAQHFRGEVSLSEIAVGRLDALVRFCERAVDDVVLPVPPHLELVG